jgi:hemerythrin-like metal-binding protein
MRPFHWTRAKSVFIAEFDAEHRNLHQIADSCYKTWSAGAPPDVIVQSVRALLDAAEDHFAHEEREMRTARYPLALWHKRQHDTVRKSGKALLTRLEGGDLQAAGELLQFLADWLHDHMAVTDRMMAASLRAHPRARAA